MKFGRELDALIAEKVMGWTNVIDNSVTHMTGGQLLGVSPDERASPFTGYLAKTYVPHYSTDMTDAWKVVEKIASCAIEHERDECRVVAIAFRGDGLPYEGRATCKTAPLAICLAALKAVGHSTDK